MLRYNKRVYNLTIHIYSQPVTRRKISNTNMAAKEHVNLYTFLESKATPVERETFADTWSFYLRNVLGLSRDSRHVWPYDLEFALRSGLVRIGKQMFGKSRSNESSQATEGDKQRETESASKGDTDEPHVNQSSLSVEQSGDNAKNDENSQTVDDRELVSLTLEDFQQWLTARESNENVQDIPASIVSSISDGSLVDPLSFPDDSQVYQSWKVISKAIETIDQGVSNIELQTRRIQRQNNTLARDIERLRKIVYVQDQFVSKFSVVSQ